MDGHHRQATWSKFGFQYPVTYIFRLADVPSDLEVERRDADDAPWTPLVEEDVGRFL